MRSTLIVLALSISPALLVAQHTHDPGMVHTPGMMMPSNSATPAATPTQPGQDAYAAIAEVVRLLEADSTTDWSHVNLEALRRHLIDMNLVTLRAASRAQPLADGLQMDVTGDAETAAAIRRMLSEHAPMLDAMPDYTASVSEIPGGMRLTVRAERPGDARTIAKIQGLGFIGLLTVGAHHAPHHLALALGQPMSHGH